MVDFVQCVSVWVYTLVYVCVVLHTAGRHMEDSIMAAYIALLIGTLIQHKQVTSISTTSGVTQIQIQVYWTCSQKANKMLSYRRETALQGAL